jgi:TonB family protein
MPPIKNITLAFHCPEKPDRKLYCDRCSHTVIDFRNKTDCELAEELRKSNRPVCGLFERTQLSGKFLKYAAATFIATSLTLPAQGQEAKEGDSWPKACENSATGEEEVFLGMVVETAAEPVGGVKKFFETISAQLNYPEGFSGRGRVFIEFTIDTAGRMENVKVLKGLNDWADKEAVRVLSTLDYPFHPARQRGRPVRMKIVIPVTFGLANGMKH